MNILGIVTRLKDSGLALLKDGMPTIVLEEERFNREKHTRKFPFRSLTAAFDGQGLGVGDIDVITTPWEMKSLRRNLFWGAAEGLPTSLFAELTGVPVVLNTSFNLQEPIVQSPENAISCYLRTQMDVLVLGDFYVTDRTLFQP